MSDLDPTLEPTAEPALEPVQSEESPELTLSDPIEDDIDAVTTSDDTDVETAESEQMRKPSQGRQVSQGRHWYVLHTYSGYEDAVSAALKQRIESMNMHEFIFDVIVPKETEIEVKKGEPKVIEKRMFPGYVLVNMIVSDESWYVVRNTPNVTGFIGAGTVPIPVAEEEIKRMRKRMGVKDAKFKADFMLQENVIITSGPFAGYDGLVSEIDEDKGRLKVLVSIFGRETPVEIEFTQVKKA